jgi:hypothetical protein
VIARKFGSDGNACRKSLSDPISFVAAEVVLDLAQPTSAAARLPCPIQIVCQRSIFKIRLVFNGLKAAIA